MSNLQKWVFIGVIILAFSNYAFAENWYAISTLEATFKNGKKGQTLIVTKVSDRDTCERVLLEKCYDVGNSKCIVKKCALGSAKKNFSGLTYDELFRNEFHKKPISSAYLYLIDLNGFEAVINLLSSQSSVIALAKFMAEKAEKGGAKNVEVVYPKGMDKLKP